MLSRFSREFMVTETCSVAGDGLLWQGIVLVSMG